MTAFRSTGVGYYSKGDDYKGVGCGQTTQLTAALLGLPQDNDQSDP